jgi:hypothetical protein
VTTAHLPDVPKPSAKLKALVTPKVRNEVSVLIAAVKIDRTKQVPYVAGVSADAKTVYIDKGVPDALSDGETEFYPEVPLRYHEVSEWYLMTKLGLDYDDAHDLATYEFEQPFVVGVLGLDWEGYQHSFDEYVRADEHEKLDDVPADLFMGPYEDDASADLLASIRRAQGNDIEKVGWTDEARAAAAEKKRMEALDAWFGNDRDTKVSFPVAASGEYRTVANKANADMDQGGKNSHWEESEQVPINQLRATQSGVNSKTVAKFRKKLPKKLPILLEHQGKFYVQDGHHRIEAQIQNGKTEINASVLHLRSPVKKDFSPSELQTLYISRPLLNGDELATWAKSQGFATTVPPDEMHVTVAYSKQPVDWSKLTAEDDTLTVPPAANRSIEALGIEKDAVVLIFDCPALAERWQQCQDIGCSWDWPSYRSHVTFTFNGNGVDLDSVVPYTGALEFGPEAFEPVDEDWKDSIKESVAKYWSDAAREAAAEARKRAAWHSDQSDLMMEHAGRWKGVDKDRERHFLGAANFHASASQGYRNAADAYKSGDKEGAEASIHEAKANESAARSLRLKHGLAVKHLDKESVAKRSNRSAEHAATITYNGDFNLKEFLRTLWVLGGWGASRDVQIAPEDKETQRSLEDNGYRTKFGWDGDGADKIVSAEVDGEDVLGADKLAKTWGPAQWEAAAEMHRSKAVEHGRKAAYHDGEAERAQDKLDNASSVREQTKYRSQIDGHLAARDAHSKAATLHRDAADNISDGRRGSYGPSEVAANAASMTANRLSGKIDKLAKIGWTDEAREAALATRRVKLVDLKPTQSLHTDREIVERSLSEDRPLTADEEIEMRSNSLDANVVDDYRAKIHAGKKLDPLLVNDKGQVLDGHHRLRAYRDEGVKEVPVEISPTGKITKLVKNDTVNVGTNLVWFDQRSGSRGGDINWNQEDDDDDEIDDDDEDLVATLKELGLR